MRALSCIGVLVAVALARSSVRAQDGSSELLIEKPQISSGNSRLRVRCTDDNLRLYHNATACADEREPESCKMIFTVASSNSPATRDPKCDNPLLKDLADSCRNTCAVCCEDPTYACQNDDSGIVNCEQNVEKCGSPEFSTMMIKFCPATCGLCLTKRCRDQIDDCEAMKSLCTNELYVVFMEHQCAKTCGKCKSDDDDENPEDIVDEIDEEEPEEPAAQTRKTAGSRTQLPSGPYAPENAGAGGAAAGGSSASGGGGSGGGGGGGSNKECVDLMKNCQRNKKFCFHPSYREMMMKNCAKTCGFCKPNGAAPVNKKTATRTTRECRDAHPFCKGWAQNGYCESDFPEEEKRARCAKTCGLCE